MKHLLKYNQIFNESSHIEDIESDISDILLELEDIGLKVDITRMGSTTRGKYNLSLEVYISRPVGANRFIPGVANPEGGYPSNLLFWYEISEYIIRLTEYYYSLDTVANPLIRFFCSGIEVFTDFKNAKDFENIGKFHSDTSFKMLINI